jgi:hypothetical protein
VLNVWETSYAPCGYRCRMMPHRVG